MESASRTVDPELVRRAQAGDTAAFGALVDATEHIVRPAVRSVVRDGPLADDVVQDTYLRAYRGLSALRDPLALHAWLRRVAVSTARNALRRRRGLAIDPVLLDALPAVPSPDADEPLRRALRRAVAALAPPERRLCDRYYRGGWTTARLARDAGVSEAAVRKRLQRLRERLGKEIEMTMDAPGDDRLADRIVELLSRPVLLELPENPVGEVWERVRRLRASDELVELTEELADADVVALLGDAAELPSNVHRVDAAHCLRWDLSVPMLLAARGLGAGVQRLAGGKVYRDDAEDHGHLQAFHQAELLWTGERLASWSAMDVLTEILDELLPGMRVRVEEADYPHLADRGYEVLVEHGGHWVGVAGWAPYSARVLEALGLRPGRHAAIGVGIGLERVAALRHDIDDIRRIESSRLGGV